MNIIQICSIVSSVSFFAYVLHYFKSPKMKTEFKRFGLEKFGLAIIILQLFGSAGLIVGLKYSPLLIISSLGLAILMIAGFVVRLKSKDGIFLSLPALFFAGLNTYIFLESIK